MNDETNLTIEVLSGRQPIDEVSIVRSSFEEGEVGLCDLSCDVLPHFLSSPYLF